MNKKILFLIFWLINVFDLLLIILIPKDTNAYQILYLMTMAMIFVIPLILTFVQGYLTIYRDFPERSDFKIPQYFEGDVNWAVIKDIGGQKARVAGYVHENVFYIVFLDKEHKFFKMKN